jgi:hypothetical protein
MTHRELIICVVALAGGGLLFGGLVATWTRLSRASQDLAAARNNVRALRRVLLVLAGELLHGALAVGFAVVVMSAIVWMRGTR